MQTLLFSTTLLISAFLLFWIQPLIGKVILPVLGGTPAVWTTCMLFFQSILLVGYSYVYFSVRLLNRWQSLFHMILILLALFFLPIATSLLGNPPTDKNPIFWLITSLFRVLGLPLLVVSATAPLLQIWYAQTMKHSVKDPYFLYSASNLGSMLGLLCFPFLLEPHLDLLKQNWLWSFGFGVLGFLILLCRTTFLNPKKEVLSTEEKKEVLTDDILLKPDNPLRIRWILLAFVPSSLLLSTTTLLTTDIAAVPLFWVIPLALYILSFIIVFAKRPLIPHDWVLRYQVYFLIPLLLLPILQFYIPTHIPLFIPIYLLVFFMIALSCHGEIVRLRPKVSYLPEFYLWIALGGLLGSLFNVLAPMIFKGYTEYALIMGLSFLLLPFMQKNKQIKVGTAIGIQLAFSVILAAFLLLLQFIKNPQIYFFIYSVLVIWVLINPENRIQLGIGVLLLLLLVKMTSQGFLLKDMKPIYQHRNFFGIVKVIDSPDNNMRLLIHGKIIHGIQSLDPALIFQISGYYAPLQIIFNQMQAIQPSLNIAIAGLGAGKLGCYARDTDSVTFYEINPDILYVAQNYFDFLKGCAPRKKIILGDARLSLKKTADHFGIIILDAFSSDSVPTHLLTLEATELYLEKLAPKGIIIFHISNHYLNLAPVLGSIAHQLGLTALIYSDSTTNWMDKPIFPSRWVVMAKESETLEFLKQAGWTPLIYKQGDPLWTDSFSNIWSVAF